MPVHLLHNIRNSQLFGIQLHLFSILCIELVPVSATWNCLRKVRLRYILNLRLNELASVLSRGSRLVLIFMVCRAFGGKRARKIRHVLARLEKGLNFVVTSVRCLVIMIGFAWSEGDG